MSGKPALAKDLEDSVVGVTLKRSSTDSVTYAYDGRNFRHAQDYELDSLSESSSTGDGDTESGSWSDDTLAHEWPFVPSSKRGRWKRRSRRWAHRTFHSLKHSPRASFVLLMALFTSLALFIVFPFPTTIHLFLGAAVGLAAWTTLSWVQLIRSIAKRFKLIGPSGPPPSSPSLSPTRNTTLHLGLLLAGTALVLSGLFRGALPIAEHVPEIPRGSDHKYFIGANFYNNEKIVPSWSSELLKVIDHLGPANTFVSIYESNSNDATPKLLAKFQQELDSRDIRNRVLSEKGGKRWWPYPTSPQRINFLAGVRNKVLEPLQSSNVSVRLPDYDEFGKVLFLNDVLYSWQSVIRLIGTTFEDEGGRENSDYDLACAMDFQLAGIYDTWVARDVCGTPFRIYWPFVEDPVSIQLLREMRPFPVSTCWNGMVVFSAKPFLYQPAAPVLADDVGARIQKRGWKMIDNTSYPNSQMSPALDSPLKFRSSGIEACDHSECFLLSYDLQRMYSGPDRPARIIMNPNVQVAYKWRWYYFYAKVLRIPIVEWWAYYWSHGVPMKSVDWIWQYFLAARDYCTWKALVNNAPARCPPLPGVPHRSWDQ